MRISDWSSDVCSSDLLSTAVSLMVRERLTGEAPPEVAREGLKLVSDWIEEKAGSDLDALGLALDDQAAFAALTSKLLRDLELVAGDLDAEHEPAGGAEGEGEDNAEGESDEDSDGEAGGGDGKADMRAQQSGRARGR